MFFIISSLDKLNEQFIRKFYLFKKSYFNLKNHVVLFATQKGSKSDKSSFSKI